MEAGSGGRFWPQASACSSEDVVSPVSSDGAPASMTALPRNPWLKQPLLFLVASCQVQHHSCNDRQVTWGGSYAYYRAETLFWPLQCTFTYSSLEPKCSYVATSSCRKGCGRLLLTWHTASWWLSGFRLLRKKQQVGAERQLEISVTECMECEVSFSAVTFQVWPETGGLTCLHHSVTTRLTQYHFKGADIRIKQ